MAPSPASHRKPAGTAARVAAAQKAMAALQHQADLSARGCVHAILRDDIPAARANAKRSKALTDRAAKLFTDATHTPSPPTAPSPVILSSWLSPCTVRHPSMHGLSPLRGDR